MDKARAAAAAAGGTRRARPPTALRRSRERSVLYAKEWGATQHYGDAEADAGCAPNSSGLVRAGATGSHRARPAPN